MPLIRAPRRRLGTGYSRTVALVSLLAATCPVALGMTPVPAAAAPSYTLVERALAIASPSLVYLESVYTGYIRDRQTNQPVLPTPITYNRRCSGFVVNSEGDVVTTRICVSPPEETIRQQMLYVAGFQLVGESKLDRGQLDAWVAARLETTVVTGLSEDSRPDVKLLAQFNIATGAITDKPAVPGTVLKSSDPNDGNVAVVKLDQGNLPAAELDTKATLASGTQLTVLGFNTTDSDPRIGSYTLHSQAVQVVGTDKLGAATYYRLNEILGTYFHGGMAIDTSGRVVGIVDEDPTLPNNQNRAVYPVSTVTPVLAAAGVHNTLGSSDQQFRAGLDAYFRGRYKTAIDDLDAVAKSVPTNQIAPVYRQNALDLQKIEGTNSGTPAWLVPVVAAVGGVLVIGLVTLLVARARGRRRRDREQVDWQPQQGRYPTPSPPSLGSPLPPWATFSPVSAPPTSAPPTSAPPTSAPPVATAAPVSNPPIYAPAPVYATETYVPPLLEPPPAEPDLGATQAVSWPPAEAMPPMPDLPPDLPSPPDPGEPDAAVQPTAPSTDAASGPPPAQPAVPSPFAPPPSPFAPPNPFASPAQQATPAPPSPAAPPAQPSPPTQPDLPAEDEQAPQLQEPIVWQQLRPTRRSIIHEEQADSGGPANPWAAPPSQQG